MLVLISGLPGAGKSSFADVLEAEVGFTHVPLDRYIKEVPATVTFLDWVATPVCIDWSLWRAHLDLLREGRACFTPSPDWKEGGRRRCEGGADGIGRRMGPSTRGYAVAGCHAFRSADNGGPVFKVFVETPRRTIAERISKAAVSEQEAEPILNRHLSRNWKEIEGYSKEADLVVSGTVSGREQMEKFLALFPKA